MQNKTPQRNTLYTIFRPIMSSSCLVSINLFLHFALLLLISHIAESHNLAENVSAFFVFGDSTVDSGNNNYIPTLAKCNFPPYGRDFPGQIPTGRFTNGRLVTDFVASYVGIKEFIPPYLDPTLTLEDLMTGVCFASAASGFDPLTAHLTSAISLQQQLNYFKELKSILESSIGNEKTRSLISSSVALISAGTNDFIANYYIEPIRSQTYSISSYERLILKLSQQFIQGLLDIGIRIIAIVGLPPMGCVPVIITLKSDDALAKRDCIESLSAVARDYNRLLQKKIKAMQRPNTTIIYVDIYKPLDDMIKRPQIYGFDEVNRGCCGTGLLEGAELCNPTSSLCDDDTKYVFWDSVHPSETTYYNIFLSVQPIIQSFLQG